jgi:hypothetical protein
MAIERQQGWRMDMDLEQFVSISLAQIIRGIAKAQADAESTNAWINPVGVSMSPERGPKVPGGTGPYSPSVYARDVEFDVALTVADSKTGEAKAGLRVWAVEIGGKGKTATENSAVSRIKFAVPVLWPWTARAEREKKSAASGP